jgi:hypothetical protein
LLSLILFSLPPEFDVGLSVGKLLFDESHNCPEANIVVEDVILVVFIH